MQVAFRVLLERFTDFALEVDASELHYPPNVLLRGLAALPISFIART
jgi:cytochrome P450